jgi:hypothetical protein
LYRFTSLLMLASYLGREGFLLIGSSFIDCSPVAVPDVVFNLCVWRNVD